ncbi:MAG: hypothetical protein V1706_15875 [Pseudomonadota bacterium]
MLIENNPAARLHNLLKSGLTLSKSEPIKNAWCNILKIENNDVSKLLNHLSLIYGLPKEIKKQIEIFDQEYSQTHFKVFPNIERAFKIVNLDTHWSTFINNIGNDTLLGLEYCSNSLSRSNPEKVIESSVIDKIIKKIDEAIEESSSEELDLELKTFILKSLVDIKLSLEKHKILGTKLVEKELLVFAASTNNDLTFFEKIIKSKFGRTLLLVVAIITWATNMTDQVLSIMPKIQPYLEMRHDGNKTIDADIIDAEFVSLTTDASEKAG